MSSFRVFGKRWDETAAVVALASCAGGVLVSALTGPAIRLRLSRSTRDRPATRLAAFRKPLLMPPLEALRTFALPF